MNAFKILIETGVNINFKYEGMSIYENPLLLSSISGLIEFVKYLVEKGSNIHTNDDIALKDAYIHNHKDIVKFLIKLDLDYFSKKNFAREIVLNYKMIEIYENFGINV